MRIYFPTCASSKTDSDTQVQASLHFSLGFILPRTNVPDKAAGPVDGEHSLRRPWTEAGDTGRE